MSVSELSSNQKFLMSKSVINMNSWFRKKITDLYNAVSAPVVGTRDALADRLQSIRESVALLYKKAKEKLGYKEVEEKKAAQPTLHDEIEEEAKKDHIEDIQRLPDKDVDLTPKEHKHALHKSFRSFRIPAIEKADVDGYIAVVTPNVKTLIEEQVKELGAAKVQLSMWIQWKKKIVRVIPLDEEELKETKDVPDSEGDAYIRIEKVFNSKMMEIFQGSDVDELLMEMFAHIKTQVEHPALPQSGFTIDRIMHLDIDFHKLKLTRGSSYIKLPSWLAHKKAIINPKNKDEECFKWAIIAALHHEEIGAHPERISKLEPFVDQYNWQGLEFPLVVSKIKKFEKNNPNIAVNVLYVKESKRKNGDITILRRSEYNVLRNKQVNLLLISDGEKKHYTTIKSLSRLLSRENRVRRDKQHFCLNCLHAFNSEKSMIKHYDYCVDHEEVKVEMPTEKDKWLKYHDGQMQFRVPFVIYGDFESLLIPIKDEKDYDENKPYTKKMNKHVPSGWCTYSKFAYGDVSDPLTLYRGKDCVEKFVDHLETEVKRLFAAFPQKPMVITPEETIEYKEAENCHICMKPFDDPKNRKVRDHCHYTGLYRGAAHNNCNLKYRIPDHIPIVFHNLSGYDAHLFIKELGKKYNTKEIGCIAENKEKYISFNVKVPVPLAGLYDTEGNQVYKKISLRFIDSCRFMALSLDKLSSNLSDKQCRIFDGFTKKRKI